MEDQPNGAKPEDPAAPVAAPDLKKENEKLRKELEVSKAKFEGFLIARIRDEDKIASQRDAIRLLELENHRLHEEVIEGIRALHSAHDYFERSMYQQAQQYRQEVEEAKKRTEKAEQDKLTKLPRREVFDEKMENLLEHERRDYVCLLLEFDAGELKRVNDDINRPMGDKMLARVSKVIRDEIRSELGPDDVEPQNYSTELREQDQRRPLLDLKARYGGDEFAVLIALSHKEDKAYVDIALRIIERCCAKFDAIDWPEEYKEWHQQRHPELATNIKPRIDPGAVIIHLGSLPRIYSGSSKRWREKIMELADDLMKESKAFRKANGSRRIFYSAVEFKNRSMKFIVERGYKDSLDIS